MATPESRPSVARRQLGRRLRRLREDAGKTIEDVTTTGVASRTKMWRLEYGRTVVKIGDVLALSRLYDADGAAVDELLRLAEATKSSGYTEYVKGAVREALWLYADLEADAATVADYQSEMIHGLLQTEAYVRAVIRATPELPPHVVDQRVTFRLNRQRAFFGRPQPGRMDAVLTAGLDQGVGQRLRWELRGAAPLRRPDRGPRHQGPAGPGPAVPPRRVRGLARRRQARRVRPPAVTASGRHSRAARPGRQRFS